LSRPDEEEAPGTSHENWGRYPRPLAPYEGKRPDAPAWFDRAMAIPCEEHRIAVEGAMIEAVSWGDPGLRPLLLLHGSMAHARWWSPVAPLLSAYYHVVAMSFSGMGGSDRRGSYCVRQMAREAMAVASAMRLFSGSLKPVLVAHSFGGKPASIIAGDHGENFAGIIFVDSFISPAMDVVDAPAYQARFYDSEPDALSRFRLSPDQPGGEPFVLDAIARAGVVEQDGRWTWRFDPDFFRKLTFENAWDELLRARCPLAHVRGEYSPIATRKDFDIQREHLRADTVFVEMPDAYHHIMAEQPLALTSTLRAIIAAWSAAEEMHRNAFGLESARSH
jgi:pimeloyl-ACP methyl ester carboxylesterase